MSNVEIAKMLILASASGVASEARIPVSSNSNGPSTFNALQFFSAFISSGTIFYGQTIESSSFVLVIAEKISLPIAHSGIFAFVSNRQTANCSGSTESESFVGFMCSDLV